MHKKSDDRLVEYAVFGHAFLIIYFFLFLLIAFDCQIWFYQKTGLKIWIPERLSNINPFTLDLMDFKITIIGWAALAYAALGLVSFVEKIFKGND